MTLEIGSSSGSEEEGDEPMSLQQRLDIFWRLATPYFNEADGAKLNLGLLLVLVLLDASISVVFSYVSRDFYSALSAKDQALFFEKTANFAVGLTLATPLTVLFKFQRQRLALNWRAWMTTELARQYYADGTYYQIENDPAVDNPDQRITEDVAAFTRVSLDFAITIMTSVIDLISFSGILYSIYPDLFYVIFVYAAFGSATTVALGKTLVGQNAEQLVREANLRYALVRLRENAESIAFYRGEVQEATSVDERLRSTVDNKRRILGTQRNLEFFTVAYTYLIQILPIIVVSPLYFAGTIELGVITQSAGAFNSILDDLSLIVNEFEGLSRFSAGLNRLATFVERMESYRAEGGDGGSANVTFALPAATTAGAATAAGEGAQAATADSDAKAAMTIERICNTESSDLPSDVTLAVRHLSLTTPDGTRTLFSNVSLSVPPGEHLLITGDSGTGKSSLLRAVAGLWTRGSGNITRPLATETMFLPQRPYCTLGSLRQQLIYPLTDAEWAEASGTDATLLQALSEVQLSRLAADGVTGLAVERDWSDELSLGEQQRLAFARAFVRTPRLIILDEATSALDLTNEALLYEALGRLPQATYISVGHRPSLLRFHASRLRLFGVARADAPSYAIDKVQDRPPGAAPAAADGGAGGS